VTADVATADRDSPGVIDVTPSRRRLSFGLAALFPIAPARPVSHRGLLLATLAVVAATVVSLLRVTGTGALQSIWEEDSRNIMSDALYSSGAKAILTPLNGYYVIVARLLGEVAAFFPMGWAAAVLSISAALILGLMVLLVYVASGAHLSSRLARFMVAAPMLVAPVAENNQSEIYNRPVCLHLFAMYVLFWVVLWVPTRRTSQLIGVGVVGLAAGSTFLAIGFIPLALLRVFVRRDRTGVGMLAMLVVGAVANGMLIQDGGGAGRGVMYPEPLVALWDYMIWGLPQSMLGFRAASGLNAFHFPTVQSVDVMAVVRTYIGVIALSWALVAAVVAVAASRRVTRPVWLLAAVAAAHSVGLFCMMVMAQGNEQRYLLPVELLLFAALTALLLPSVRFPTLRAHAPLVVFAVFVTVVSAFNYRWDNTYRANAPRWSDQVNRAAAACRLPGAQDVSVRSAPEPFGSLVFIPCRRLGTERPWGCAPPLCIPVNGPATAPPRRGS
jgi:hypothetical protein